MARLHGVALCVAALAVTPVAASEAAPSFILPVDCRPGVDCAVQHYVDQDPGPGAADYACGYLTYDGHKGTDLRLADRSQLARRVAVLAAAAGTVLRVRDGMPDISVRDKGAPSVEGREAGNSVIIDHGGGWQTQYGHLLRGSVLVEPGDTVEAGEPIGAIGLSGQTEFPHVHFEVRLNGETVDPFTGVLAEPGCGQAGTPLWAPSAASALAYHETGLLAAGFVGTPPDGEAIRAGAYANAVVDARSEALVFWVSLYGTYPRDRQSFTLTGPDGTVLIDETSELPDAPKQEWRAWAGRRQPAFGWPRGTYTATYRLERGGRPVVEVRRTVDIQ